MSQLGAIIEQIRKERIPVVHIRDIDFNAVEDKELKELASLIREMPNLSSVAFRNVNLASISIENLKLIFEAIQSRKENLQVSLVNNNLGVSPEKFLLIMEYLSTANVKELNLSSNNLYCLNEEAFVQLLSFRPNLNLRKINLSSNSLGRLSGEELLKLGQYLVSCHEITDLQLHSNSLGTNPLVEKFLELLLQLHLEELNLANDSLGELANPDMNINIGRIAELLAQHQTLQRLNLADNLLCAWGAENLTLFLKFILQCNKLHYLDLKANQFGVLQDTEEWDNFLSYFISFIRETTSGGLKLVFNYLNFDEETSIELSKEIPQQEASSQPPSFFSPDTEISAVVIKEFADKTLSIMQSSPELIRSLKKQPSEQFRDFFVRVSDILFSEISQMRTPPATSPVPVNTSIKATQ